MIEYNIFLFCNTKFEGKYDSNFFEEYIPVLFRKIKVNEEKFNYILEKLDVEEFYLGTYDPPSSFCPVLGIRKDSTITLFFPTITIVTTSSSGSGEDKVGTINGIMVPADLPVTKTFEKFIRGMKGPIVNHDEINDKCIYKFLEKGPSYFVETTDKEQDSLEELWKIVQEKKRKTPVNKN